MMSRSTVRQLTDYPPGWTCEVVLHRLDRYVAAQLPRAELLAISEHIEACALCMERVMLSWRTHEWTTSRE
jgi:hypothetical protein